MSVKELEDKALQIRLDILNAIKIAGKGHIGGSYSIVDILVTLYYGDIINFDLDGLADTHSKYRINTKFENVLSNAKSVIATNRPQVHWKYIVF